jgi:ParB family chromosome partitioning protein
VSTTPTSRSTVVLPLADIDAPELDARLGRDPEKLEELSRDILRRGLIEPVKVFAKGDRFELVDGFRRFLATKNAGLTVIECFVYPSKATALEGIKYAANAFREDMSPAEEAIYFFQLLRTECENDIERLAALVGKKIYYVDSRLQLVMGDELVFEAVKDRKITLGVAAELNALPDDSWRRYYLQHAIQSGATVALVSGWVMEWKNMYGARVESPEPPAPASASVYVSTYDPLKCVVCQQNDPRQVPEQISVHTSCKVAILEKLLAAYRGEP